MHRQWMPDTENVLSRRASSSSQSSARKVTSLNTPGDSCEVQAHLDML